MASHEPRWVPCCARVRERRSMMWLHGLRVVRARQAGRTGDETAAAAALPGRRGRVHCARSRRTRRCGARRYSPQAARGPDGGSRLATFESHYGGDVLAAARAGGDPARLAAAWSVAASAALRRRVASVRRVDPCRELDCGGNTRSVARAGRRGRCPPRARACRVERRGRRSRQPRDPKRGCARPWRRCVRRPLPCEVAAPSSWRASSRAGSLRRRPLRAQPRVPPTRPARSLSVHAYADVEEAVASMSRLLRARRAPTAPVALQRRGPRRRAATRARRTPGDGVRVFPEPGMSSSGVARSRSHSTAGRSRRRSCRRMLTPTRFRSSSGSMGSRSSSIRACRRTRRG